MPPPLSSTASALSAHRSEGITADPEPGAGVIDLYRSVVGTAAATVRRHRLDVVTDVALVALYLVLRTAGADSRLLGPWLVAALIVALIAPTSGLVILASIAPFGEGFFLTRDVGAKTVLALAVLAAVAVRYLVDRGARIRPSLPVVLAGLLFLASGLSLLQTWIRWGADYADAAAQLWFQGVGVMLIVFVVAVWTAQRGQLRPLVAAIAATAAAGIASLADFVGGTPVHDGLLSWALVGDQIDRLEGVIQSPTATAAMVMLPTMSLLVAAILAPVSRRVRLLLALVAIPLLAATYLTFNRAFFIALFAVVVLIGWRVRHRLGIAILGVGLVASIILVPVYLSARSGTLGSAVEPGQVLIASDVQRLGAWNAAARMFVDRPLFGQGYRAYRQLSVQFGDPILNAPHNEWLRFFAEGGIVVGGLALAFLAVTFLRLARQAHWLVTAALASFGSLVIAASFNNPFLFNQVTIPGFLIAGSGIGYAQRLAMATTRRGPPDEIDTETAASAATMDPADG